MVYRPVRSNYRGYFLSQRGFYEEIMIFAGDILQNKRKNVILSTFTLDFFLKKFYIKDGVTIQTESLSENLKSFARRSSPADRTACFVVFITYTGIRGNRKLRVAETSGGKAD